MKIKFLFFCLINGSLLFSQNELNVGIYDSRKENDLDHKFVHFSLYKNDSLYGEYTYPFIKGLTKGNYYIKYDTYFGERKSESQYIDEKSFLPFFDVYVDSLAYNDKVATTNLYIDNLDEDNELQIYRRYSGCFNYKELDSLIVKKEKGDYFIIRNNKKRKLKQKQLIALRDFEIQMRNIKKSGYYSTAECLTWIVHDKNRISFLNPSGDWEGYEYLLIQLGYIKKRKSLYFKNR